MKIAVVGGGIFGCTAAITLARAGHSVDLYESSTTLLSGASSHNQFRLHAGYHYPRSPETGAECRAALPLFREEYGEAIEKGSQFYAIASDSKVRPVEYLNFLDKAGLEYRGKSAGVAENVDLLLKVEEERFDPWALRAVVERNLRSAGVQTFMGVRANRDMLSVYDRIVVATYHATGEWTEDRLQFETVEKPVLWIPPCEFTAYKTGVVVMDGPYCSLDPMGRTGLYVMGHVERTIHHRSVGRVPVIPRFLQPYINKGVINAPKQSRHKDMIEDGARFLPVLKTALYVGSMFTVRAVLPNVDATDKRPTLVAMDGNVIRVFSGKIPTCVTAAREVLSLVDTPVRMVA